MRKILILLLFSIAASGQQISVQNNELKYRTSSGIATAAGKDSLTTLKNRFIADSVRLNTEAANIDNLQADRNALFDSVSNKVNKIVGKGLSTNDYTTAEKTKLTGIATGATANSTDAALRDRTTHTGVQAISSVTGLQTALDGKLSLVNNRIFTTGSYPAFRSTGSTGAFVEIGYHDLELTPYIGTNSNVETSLDFRTNNTVKMRLGGSGNLGIGTFAPAQKLHVVGNTATTKLLVNTTTDAGYQADINGGSIFRGRISQTFTNDSLVINHLNSGFTTRYIDFGGIYRGQIGFVKGVGARYDEGLFFIDPGYNKDFVIVNRPLNGAVSNLSIADEIFRVQTINKRVGIGMHNPLQKLHVNGNIRIENATDGLILKTPDGTKTFKITIDNSGNLISTQQ